MLSKTILNKKTTWLKTKHPSVHHTRTSKNHVDFFLNPFSRYRFSTICCALFYGQSLNLYGDLYHRNKKKTKSKTVIFSNSRKLLLHGMTLLHLKEHHSISYACYNCKTQEDKGVIGYETSYPQKMTYITCLFGTVRTCNGTGKKVKVALKSYVSTLTLAAAEFSRLRCGEAAAEQVVL